MVRGGLGGFGSGQTGRRGRGLSHFIVRRNGNMGGGAVAFTRWIGGISVRDTADGSSGIEKGVEWFVGNF